MAKVLQMARLSSMDGGLRSIFRQRLKNWHWQSIESGFTGGGIPDVNFCAPGGVEGWIEFKESQGWTVRLAPMQVGWLMRRSRLGGRCFIAVRQRLMGIGGKTETFYLYAGADAAILTEAGAMKTSVPLVRSSGGPSDWDWSAIGRILGGISDG